MRVRRHTEGEEAHRGTQRVRVRRHTEGEGEEAHRGTQRHTEGEGEEAHRGTQGVMVRRAIGYCLQAKSREPPM